MNPDLAKERAVSHFDQKALTSYLYGGEEKVQRRRVIAKMVESVPTFDDPRDPVFMSREERIGNSMRKTMAMIKYLDDVNLDDPEEVNYYRRLVMASDNSPAELHYTMFMPTIRGQASDEQQEKWLNLAITGSILGTYAQTELGHGTNLRNLETTATYDPRSQEFIIHSPTLTSTKWWPGNLGKVTNHAVVMAQLYTLSKCRGVHAFMVPIRDEDTHEPLPGVTVGDIGPKFGIPANDNGFLRFDNVRVPRENMLMRFARLEPDGTYVPPSHAKLSYGSMIFVRALMINDQALSLARACTIATRYSCVRRQGEKVEGAGEVQLLDYQTQQYRLFPEIAKTFAMYFAGVHMRSLYLGVSEKVRRGDISALPDLHALSSGLKAVVAREVAEGIENCRLACGGHGYLLASGLPELYANTVGGCTYEGDNVVLLLQTARSLMKLVRNGGLSRNVQNENSVVDYVFDTGAPSKCRLDQDLRIEDIHDAYKHAARRLIHESAQLLDNYESRGYKAEESWDQCAVQLTKCAKAHVRTFIVGKFIDAVNASPDNEPTLKPVLLMLCQLYALCGILARSGNFLEDGYLTKQQMHYIRHRLGQLLASIRPMAVQIVDAFEFRDRELRSVLGRFDGNVYENLYKWARSSPLNEKEVLDCVKTLLVPTLKENKSKL